MRTPNRPAANISQHDRGANGDEGLGFLSWSMDWQYVGTDELVFPLNTLVNQLIGYLGCIVLTTAAYYGNLWVSTIFYVLLSTIVDLSKSSLLLKSQYGNKFHWLRHLLPTCSPLIHLPCTNRESLLTVTKNAKTFPFMAQSLFLANGTLYDQTEILGPDNNVDPALLDSYGVPWFAMSNALSLMCLNMAVTAGIVHIICWNWIDIRHLFVWLLPSNFMAHVKEAKADGRYKFWKGSDYVETFPGTEGDAHFAAMQKYKEAPSWWYHLILVLALVVGLIVTYQQKTQLPWCKCKRK